MKIMSTALMSKHNAPLHMTVTSHSPLLNY